MSAPTRARPRWPYPVGGLAVAVTALAVLLWYGGAARREPLPGLPNPGTVTLWALPVARLGNQIFVVATVGLLLAAVVLSPRDGTGLSVTGYCAPRGGQRWGGACPRRPPCVSPSRI